jgi:hypothetical protein
MLHGEQDRQYLVPDHQSADLKQLADSYFSVLTQRPASQCRRRKSAYQSFSSEAERV